LAGSDRDKELLKKREKEERKKAKALAKSKRKFGGNRKDNDKIEEKRRLDVNKHKLEVNITEDDLEELGASSLKELEKAQNKIDGTATNVSSKDYKAKLKEAQERRKKEVRKKKRRALATSAVLGLLFLITVFVSLNKGAIFTNDGGSGGGGGGESVDFSAVTSMVIDIVPLILLIQIIRMFTNTFQDIGESGEGSGEGSSSGGGGE